MLKIVCLMVLLFHSFISCKPAGNTSQVKTNDNSKVKLEDSIGHIPQGMREALQQYFNSPTSPKCVASFSERRRFPINREYDACMATRVALDSKGDVSKCNQVSYSIMCLGVVTGLFGQCETLSESSSGYAINYCLGVKTARKILSKGYEDICRKTDFSNGPGMSVCVAISSLDLGAKIDKRFPDTSISEGNLPPYAIYENQENSSTPGYMRNLKQKKPVLIDLSNSEKTLLALKNDLISTDDRFVIETIFSIGWIADIQTLTPLQRKILPILLKVKRPVLEDVKSELPISDIKLLSLDDNYKNEQRGIMKLGLELKTQYFRDNELRLFEVTMNKSDGKIYDSTKNLVNSALSSESRFIVTPSGKMRILYYPVYKYFYHSSLAQGSDVLCAGKIDVVAGVVVSLNNHTGHYKTPKENLKHCLNLLVNKGLNLGNAMIKIRGDIGEEIASIEDFPGLSPQMEAKFLSQRTKFKKDNPSAHVVNIASETADKLNESFVFDSVDPSPSLDSKNAVLSPTKHFTKIRSLLSSGKNNLIVFARNFLRVVE